MRGVRVRETAAAFLATAALAAVLAVVPAVLGPPVPAAADYGAGQVLTDKIAYGPNEPIYAAGAAIFVSDCDKRPQKGGVNDIFQTWSDLYIVRSGSVTAGGALADVSGAPNVIRGGLAGGFVEQLIGATGPGGTIGAGTYDIVLDECQDQRFDAEDTLITDAFRVTIPIGTEPATIAGVDKARASDLAGDYAVLEKAWGALLKAAGKKPASATGPVSYSSDLSVAMFQVMTQTVLPDPRPAASAAITQLKRSYQGLAADPPDPVFAEHASPRIEGLDGAGTSVGTSRLGTAEENVILDVARSAEVDAALIQALVDSVEKHQGAAQVGDGDWMAQHARQALALIDVIEARASVTPDLLDAAASTWAGSSGWQRWTQILVERWRHFDLYGPHFYSDQRDGMNRGLTAEEVHLAMAADVAEASDTGRLLTTAANLTAALRSTAARQRTASTDLAALRTDLERSIAGVEAEGRDAPRPTVAAGGPYSTTTGTPFVLDGSASSGSDGSAVTDWAWDLDLDGDFDDANGATPTVTLSVPGERVVALKVTDARGADAIGFATVSVADGDRRPIITSATPTPSVLTVDAGEAFSLAVEASDPEGGPVTVSWHRNGVALGATGPTFAGVGHSEAGAVQYEAVATDAAGNRTSWPFVVTVFAPDADGDGWRANADCDDNDSTVHPARGEITGNGKDDDCNPDTTDEPTAPRNIAMSRNTDITTRMGITEGDRFAFTTTGWIHPSRYSGEPFTYEVDWGDGEVTTGSVSGTNYDETVIAGEHVYRTSGLMQPTLCITAPDGLTGCSARSPYTVEKVLAAPPVVHPADLRQWTPEKAGRPGATAYDTTGARWLVGAGGHSASQEVNVNHPTVLLSDEDLDTSSGSGRVAFDVATPSGGDDDWFGFALGLDPDEINRDDADWLAVRLGAHLESGNVISTCGGTGTPVSETDPASLARFRGYGAWAEYALLRTLSIPDATDPLCNDDAGAELIASTKLPADLARGPSGFWQVLVHPSDASPGSRTQLYHFEVEYSPAEVTVWIDGALLFHAEAPPGDPFPQGRFGLLTHSQAYTRVIGHRPVPVEHVTQGTAEEFSAEFASADLTGGHTAVIDWGDGQPASQGTIEEVPGKPGFWTVKATHAYSGVGQFQANVCVTDPVDDQTGCGLITVNVENAAPVVDAGRDGTTLSEFELIGAHLSDPGTFDTHTATVDWGDGSPVEPATLTGRPGSLIIDAAHAYASPGTYTVEVCGTDEAPLAADGGDELTGSKPPTDPAAVPITSCDTATVTVLAALATPETLVDEDKTVEEGDVVTFGVGYADATRGAVHSVTVDWGDGSPAEVVAVQSDGSFGSGWGSHSYGDDGVYEVTVTTRSRWTPPIDGAEEQERSSSNTATITVSPASTTTTTEPTTTTSTTEPTTTTSTTEPAETTSTTEPTTTSTTSTSTTVAVPSSTSTSTTSTSTTSTSATSTSTSTTVAAPISTSTTSAAAPTTIDPPVSSVPASTVDPVDVDSIHEDSAYVDSAHPDATDPGAIDSSTADPLPLTGSPLGPWTVLLGFVLLGLGTWMVRLRRKLDGR